MEKQLRRRYFNDNVQSLLIENTIDRRETEEFTSSFKENGKNKTEQYVVFSSKCIVEGIDIGNDKENPRVRVTKDGRILEVHVKVISIAEALRRLRERRIERQAQYLGS